MATAETVRERFIINYLPNATTEEHETLRTYEKWADEYYAKAKATKNPAEYSYYVAEYFSYKRRAEELREEISRRK